MINLIESEALNSGPYTTLEAALKVFLNEGWGILATCNGVGNNTEIGEVLTGKILNLSASMRVFETQDALGNIHCLSAPGAHSFALDLLSKFEHDKHAWDNPRKAAILSRRGTDFVYIAYGTAFPFTWRYPAYYSACRHFRSKPKTTTMLNLAEPMLFVCHDFEILKKLITSSLVKRGNFELAHELDIQTKDADLESYLKVASSYLKIILPEPPQLL